MIDWQKKKEEEFEKQKTALVNDALKKANDDTLAKVKALEEDARIKTQQVQDLQKKD